MAFYAGLITLIFGIYFTSTVIEHNKYWLYLFGSIVGGLTMYLIFAFLQYFGCLS